MNDFNEQQGDESKSEQKDRAGQSRSSCGGGSGSPSHGWDDGCGCGSTPSTHSTDFGYSRSPDPAESETVFADQSDAGSSIDAASNLTAEEREELWDGLVRSQQPDPASSSSTTSTPVTETVAKNPMQWTLVDLTSSCDKPGCDPAACDSEDCDTNEEYDRTEYEYAGAGDGRAPAVTFDSDESRDYAFSEGPSPAPTAFEPSEPQARELAVEAAKPKKAVKVKQPAAAKATAKKAKTTKAGAKKAATKAKAKKGAKKATTKAASKKAAKKPASKAKKSAATNPVQPLPLHDPHFPHEQAA